jgi:hypothetical protein
MTGEMAALWAYLAAQLINSGLADLETMIADIERTAADAPDGQGVMYPHAIETLKKLRPWGVIDGGKDGAA